MNYDKVVRFLALIVTLPGLCLMSVSPVAASTLSLPQQYVHEGLTFSSALTYDSADAPVLHVTFTTPEIIEVKKPTAPEVLAEKIVSPMPKKLHFVQATSLPSLVKKAEAAEKDIEPTSTETPTPRPKADQPLVDTPTPTPVPATAALPSYATNGSLNADVLFSMANQKRAEAGLPAFEKQPDVCAVAESRKPEIENEIYGSSSIHAGFRARTLPWRATENMISQNTEEQAMNWWMNSSIHRAAILGSAKYACVVCQNKTCAMIFSSLDPK